MAQVSLPYTLTAGTPENVNNLMSNLNALVAGVNTIDTAQIASSAVTLAKLDATTVAPLNAKAVLHVRDEKTSGVAGGSFTSGAWRTRDLNQSKTNTITGASLSSNQITLPTGSYWIDASAPAIKVDSHRVRLYNTTASAEILLGTTEYAVNTVDAHTRSFVRGAFTLSGSSVLELQHRCTTTYNTNGFGLASGLGTEVYAEVVIWKTA